MKPIYVTLLCTETLQLTSHQMALPQSRFARFTSWFHLDSGSLSGAMATSSHPSWSFRMLSSVWGIWRHFRHHVMLTSALASCFQRMLINRMSRIILPTRVVLRYPNKVASVASLNMSSTIEAYLLPQRGGGGGGFTMLPHTWICSNVFTWGPSSPNPSYFPIPYGEPTWP